MAIAHEGGCRGIPKGYAKYRGYTVRDLNGDLVKRTRLLSTDDCLIATLLDFEETEEHKYMKWISNEQIDYRWEEHLYGYYRGHQFYLMYELEDNYCLYTEDFQLGKLLEFKWPDKAHMEKWVSRDEVYHISKETKMYVWNGSRWDQV